MKITTKSLVKRIDYKLRMFKEVRSKYELNSNDIKIERINFNSILEDIYNTNSVKIRNKLKQILLNDTDIYEKISMTKIILEDKNQRILELIRFMNKLDIVIRQLRVVRRSVSEINIYSKSKMNTNCHNLSIL